MNTLQLTIKSLSSRLLLTVCIFIASSSFAFSQLSWANVENGTYISKCYPNEKIFFNGESGKGWWLVNITWKRGVIEKQYTLTHNQKINNCTQEIIEDQKMNNIIRIKNNNAVLISITSQTSFKTSDGCEWKYVSDKLPKAN